MNQRSDSAIKLSEKRKKQKEYTDEYHHPKEKIDQINRILNFKTYDNKFKILELFCGNGNLTKIYNNYGIVSAYDKICGDGDSYRLFHKLIYDKKLYNLIDLDPYGFPCRFFPDIFLLINDGYLIVTVCKLKKANLWTLKLMESYFKARKPNETQIIDTICNEGMKHWRFVKPIDILNLEKVIRIAFSVKKVNACTYCGTTNKMRIR